MANDNGVEIAQGIVTGYETPKIGIGMRHTGGERFLEGDDAKKYVDQAPDILVCQIKIWDPVAKGIQPAPAKGECKMVLHEVESLTVNSSYKNIISTASIVIPKGSIIKKVVTSAAVNQNTEAQDPQIATDMKTESPEAKVDNDVSSDANKVGDTSLYEPDHVNSIGILLTTSTESGKPVEPSMFSNGDRIEIRCGYTQDPLVAEKIDEYEDHKCLNLVFSGYITGISPQSPIELRCEDLAYVFKTVSCDDVLSKGNRKVMDFFDAGGKYDWLNGTGIELHPDVSKQDINVGAVNVTHHITVADVLHEWSKSGLVCFMRRCDDGIFRLSIGRTYMSTTATDTADSVMYHPEGDGIPVIYSDWDIADDGLSIMEVDKKFVIIDAEGWKVENGQNYHCKFSLRLNPEWSPQNNSVEKYQFINDKDWTSNRKGKRKKGSRETVQNKVAELKNYSRYPYMAKKWGLTKDELKREAIEYYENFNPSGVTGKLTIFGGRDIVPTSIIALVDIRQPARQGFYVVEEVNTKFGVNGYRQEITLPYRIKVFDNVKVIK